MWPRHTHTCLTALCPGLPKWAGTRKIKPIWILLNQETISGSGISWAICKSAPREITMPAPQQSLFTGQMPFLPSNLQCQSTEGSSWSIHSMLFVRGQHKAMQPACHHYRGNLCSTYTVQCHRRHFNIDYFTLHYITTSGVLGGHTWVYAVYQPPGFFDSVYSLQWS